MDLLSSTLWPSNIRTALSPFGVLPFDRDVYTSKPISSMQILCSSNASCTSQLANSMRSSSRSGAFDCIGTGRTFLMPMHWASRCLLIACWDTYGLLGRSILICRLSSTNVIVVAWRPPFVWDMQPFRQFWCCASHRMPANEFHPFAKTAPQCFVQSVVQYPIAVPTLDSLRHPCTRPQAVVYQCVAMALWLSRRDMQNNEYQTRIFYGILMIYKMDRFKVT